MQQSKSLQGSVSSSVILKRIGENGESGKWTGHAVRMQRIGNKTLIRSRKTQIHTTKAEFQKGKRDHEKKTKEK
jgi:hypothetical protein